MADNFGVGIHGPGLPVDLVLELLPRLADEAWWREHREPIYARLPGYRVSKFQGLLPVEAQKELVAGMLMDVEGASCMSGGLRARRGLESCA